MLEQLHGRDEHRAGQPQAVFTCESALKARDALDPIFQDTAGSITVGSGRIRIFTRSGCNLIKPESFADQT